MFEWLRRAYERLRGHLLRHSVASAILYIIYRMANSIVMMLVFQVFTLEPGDLDLSLLPDWDDQWRFLSFDELYHFAKQDPSLELDGSFLSAALIRGDRCYGFIENGMLGAYTWYATRPVPVSEWLTAHFRGDYIYMYKAFTAKAFRGRRLCGTGAARAFRTLLAEGRYKGLVSYIEVHNQPSLKALKRIGFKAVGKTLVLGTNGPRLSYSSLCRRGLFRIAIRPPKTQRLAK